MRFVSGVIVSLILALTTILESVAEIIVSLSGKLPVLLAVLVAAVFVRLARGLPTLPYEKIKSSESRRAISAFRALVRSYVNTFVVFVAAILLNLIIPEIRLQENSETLRRVLIFALAFSDFLVIVSIYFLVRSDVSLSLIQADLMDQVTDDTATDHAKLTSQSVKDAFRVGPEGE